MRSEFRRSDSHGKTNSHSGCGGSWRFLALCLAALASWPMSATADPVVLYEDTFESPTPLDGWDLSGDWRFRTSSACLPNALGFTSPSTALVFDYASTCGYRNNRFGFAAMLQDVSIPITLSSVKLTWSDFTGAELGADFYFVQLSTDGGQTWPFELLRDSKDELFWDEEEIDLSDFVGETVRLRFGFTSDPTITNVGWHLDDVRIIGEPLADGISALALGGATVVEGNSGITPIIFPITIDPPNPESIALEFRTKNATAFAGLDYVAASGPITIPPNTGTHPITLNVLGDAFFEPTETFTVEIVNASSNALITISDGIGQITDDDSLDCLFEEDFETPEGTFPWTTGFPPGQLPTDPDCSPNPLNPNCDLQLWHIQQVSACVTPSGFTSPSRALVFNRETNCSYDTPGGVEGAVQMTDGITIPDVDALTAQLSFHHFLEVAYNAIQPAATTAYVEISKNGISGPFEVLRTFAPELPSEDNFVIPWREEVISLNDYIGEDVFVRFRFVQPDEVNPNTARGWYIDDLRICYAPRPAGVSKVTISPANANEGNSGTGNLTFPITVEPANTTPISLSYQTSASAGASAATPDVDYLSTNGAVNIPTNSTSASVKVILLGDDEPEPDEHLNLGLTGVSPNVYVVTEQVEGIILNDDTPSTIQVGVIDTLATSVPESAGTVTFVAQLSQARTKPIDVSFTTRNKTAVAGPGLDFLSATGTLHFPANTTQATFSVTIFDDNQYEDADDITPGKQDEVFEIVLTTTSPFAAGGVTEIAIVDNDAVTPGASTLTINDVSVTEGSCETVSSPEPCALLGTVTFTLTLDAPNAGDISFMYTTQDDTAVAGVDYEAKSGSITIPAFDTQATISVNIWADRQIEGDADGNEYFDLVLFSPVGNVNVKDNTGRCILRDDDYSGMTFGISSGDIVLRDLDQATPRTFPLVGGVLALQSAEFRGFSFDTLYGFQNNRLFEVSLVDGSFSDIVDLTATLGGGEQWSGLAWDHTNGAAVAVATDGSVSAFDLATGLTGVLTNLGVKWLDVAIHPTTGRIYGIARGAGTDAVLYRIDRGAAWSLLQIGTLSDVVAGDAAQDANWDADFHDSTLSLYVNAYATGSGGDRWVTLEVDLEAGETPGVVDTRVALENPPATSLVIASSPTPPSVEWTSDLPYEESRPTGLQLVGDATELPEASDFGKVASGVGDVNNDTFEDFIVTASKADVDEDSALFTQAGRAFLIFGGPQGSSVQRLVELISSDDVTVDSNLLDGANGIVINGSADQEQLGVSATGVGDMNGDLIADFAIGFLGANQQGGVYLIFGASTLPQSFFSSQIGDPAVGASVAGVKISGAVAGDKAGFSISGAGDFNGNALPELIVGAPGANSGAGAAYVVFGTSSGLGTNGLISLQSLSPTRGIRILGEAAGDEFGASVSGVGDLNGDGLDDIAFGAPGSFTDDGSVVVLFGHVDYAKSNAPNPINLVRLRDGNPGTVPPTPNSLYFTVKIPAKDGLNELYNPSIILLPPFKPGDLGQIPGMRLTGEGGRFGTSVQGIGDASGDGMDDLIASAPEFDGAGAAEPHWGRCYLMIGAEGEAHNPESLAADIGSAVPGLLLEGINDGDLTGMAVAGAGDANGDGYMDVLIGAPQATPGGFSGETYLLYGNAGLSGVLSLRDLANPSPEAALGKYLYATHAGNISLGIAVSGAGDFDNDGLPDLLVGRSAGAFMLLGSSLGIQAKYTNRIRSGKSPLDSLPGGSTASLGDVVSRDVGSTGEGSHSIPASRARIQFTGGGFGNELAAASTQMVTLFRHPAPDVPVGRGAEDDNLWVPGGVHWLVQTNRTDFKESKIDFHYRAADVAGFDLQRVAIFYAKPNAPLSSSSTWSWLPYVHDPDRRVFSVTRQHGSNAQTEFNGYYALIQADLITYLGGVIPAVGVTPDNVDPNGPQVSPPGKTFWHSVEKKLYAVQEGELTIRWKNSLLEVVSEVKAVNLWPRDESGVYQTYMEGAPPVDLSATGPFAFPYTKLKAFDPGVVGIDSRNLTDDVLTGKRFWAQRTLSNPGRALVMLSTDPQPDQGTLFFQFIKVVKWDESPHFIGNVLWDIGRVIEPGSDVNYRTYHDELAGSPYVIFEKAPYAPATDRYPGFYDRTARTGSIVPVNVKRSTDNDLALSFYQRGAKLIEARTGNPARNPANNQPLSTFAWPYKSARYLVNWPASTDKIIIARQDGSRDLDVGTYGSELDVYVQNDPALPGFNPNEEHALIAPFGSGKAVFALRDDLNNTDINSSTYTSQPYALLTYFDPNDLLPDGSPRAKTRPYRVVATEGIYQFQPWPGVSGAADPYEGTAGAFIQAPYPLSTLRYSDDNSFTSASLNYVFEDRTGHHWAKSATGITNSIEMLLYYPAQPDFYFPAAYKSKYGTTSADPRDFAADDDVPFLDGGPNVAALTPKPVKYQTEWPADIPTLNLGEVLIEAKFGLPQINGQCSVDVVYQESVATSGDATKTSVALIDPVRTRSVSLTEVPTGIATAFSGGEIVFPDLPPALYFRLSYDQLEQKLKWKGILVDPVTGFDYVLLNVITTADKAVIQSLSSDPAWISATNSLATNASSVHIINDSSVDPYDVLALTTGNAKGTGYVTLALQNANSCDPLPVSLSILRVVDDLNPGSIAVVKPGCVFEEKLTLLHTNDFQGKPQDFDFEWRYVPDEGGTLPPAPNPADPTDPWREPPLDTPSSGAGVNTITIKGPGLLTLTDNWFAVRYKSATNAQPYGNRWSDWTPVQLAEGWIKRVVGSINPFTQRAGGGGIAGAEEQFAAFGSGTPNTIVSMISQAGPRWTGDVPLNCDNLDDFGLIPIYETVLGRGSDLSINALSPVNNPGVNTALLLVGSRINDLYTLLGNEAYADAQDPTIAFGTDDGEYGTEATSIHAFMNQTSSLLDEELALLRGRDATFAPSIETSPIHNRLIWNFTRDISGGEVAYALNYNIVDNPEGDGVISEADAKRLYPQGHGDAWGHYLTALSTYYKLLAHPFYTWVNRSEAVLVGGAPVTVDYIDERKFARTAAAKAQVGNEIVNLAYRQKYVEDPAGQWQGYKDKDPTRAWGFSEWSSRAGQGAYIDWVVGNAILRAVDPDPSHTGIQKIDRTTVSDLREIPIAYDQIQAKCDMADLGLNPLGIGTDVVPFDISPSQIDDGLTHFEQIYLRAQTAMNNAAAAFNRANNSTQLLRRQADSQQDFQRTVRDAELDFKARLIEIFGYPYADDIGPSGLYETGYDGPDIFHYMYADPVGIQRDGLIQDLFFDPDTLADTTDSIPDSAEITMDELATSQNFRIGEGDQTFVVGVRNYGAVASCDLGPFVNSDGNIPDTLPTNCISLPSTGPVSATPVYVSYNVSTAGGKLGIRKPSSWTSERRAPGEIQVARSEFLQAIGSFLKSIDDYGGLTGQVQDQIELIQATYGISAAKLELVNDKLDNKKDAQKKILAMTATKIALTAAADIVLAIGEATEKSVPTVTGIIVGFSNGVIIDGLAPVRGGLSAGFKAAIAVLKAAASLLDIGVLVVQQENEREDLEIEIDISTIDGQFSNLQSILALQQLLRNEIPLRIAIHNAHEEVIQAGGKYLQALADGQRVLERREILRRQTAADVQQQRYRDMAFRIFRNDALQKYRAQFDLAARYVFLSAKAYDYETTMLSSDPMAGQHFLTEIVKARQLGTIIDGDPQPGTGLAESMAVMSRNFSVLSGQLGFNNPQQETNRFSFRYEMFRILGGADGDEAWRNTLKQDYQSAGLGTAPNLWDVPEFRQFCVPPDGFGSVEPGIVIPFSTTIEEGKNFFGQDIGGLDNSYDSTQFATKIRSVGVWFSNYDYLSLSNTPRVYLVPTGTDIMRSPTGYTGQKRFFTVMDQVLPPPFPIGQSDLDDPYWIPSVDSLAGNLIPIRRFGRLRAFHDSGEFSPNEVQSDSRLVGRSVWNTRWMLIIPASTLGNDRDEALTTFIEGLETDDGGRDGNGVSDIKLFFETYAFPRLKKAAATTVVAQPVEKN